MTRLVYMTSTTPKAHKIPTDATVRDLYATALLCGKPDCKEPLMRTIEGKDKTILNSTVAHIHARSPKGPRWIEMSEEDNRSHANLIPLCFMHSKEVDHKDLLDDFPAELLEEWKVKQLAECNIAKAYLLSDDQVDEIKQASFNSGNVSSEQAIMKVVKSTSTFCSVARRKVLPISSSAKSWHEVERLGREDRSAWNDDGTFVRSFPTGRDAIERKESIENGLLEVLHELNPLADDLLAELAALDVLHPEFKEHSSYLSQTIERLMSNIEISSLESPWFNYELIDAIFSKVDTAIDRLGAVWRGEDVDELVEEVPEDVDIDTTVSEGQKEFDEWWVRHSERVAEGRRYGRATNIEFDIQLFSDLLADAKFLSSMPFSFLERDSFLGTISAASHVLMCATDTDIKSLLLEVIKLTPIALPAILVSYLMEHAVKENRLDLIEIIESINEPLLLSVDVINKDFWKENDLYADRILGYLTAVKSFDEVKSEIANAINDDPELVNLVLPALTPYIDSIDRQSGESTLKQTLHSGGGVSILIPIAECISAIQSQYPDLEPHGRFAASHYPEIEKELASQLLEIHNQS